MDLTSDSSMPVNGDVLTIMGFGSTSEGASGSDVLLDAQVNAVKPEDCSSALSPYYVPQDSMLCAIGDGTDT